MKYFPKNTLAYVNSAPHFHRRELAHIPVEVLAKSTKKYRQDAGQVFPNDEALKFYATNHCAAIIRKSFTQNEPLPDWAQQVMTTYVDMVAAQTNRLLHYIVSICTREMRHIHTTTTEATWAKIEKDFGIEMSAFIKSLPGYNENSAVQQYMDFPPETTIGKYMGAMSLAFHKGKWSSSFGGKAWGLVSDAVVAFITGKNSAEMMVDTAYMLAHNSAHAAHKL